MATKNSLALAGLMYGSFAPGTDFTGALLLVPSIDADFSADITTMQWMLNIYALTYAMFMASGAQLGAPVARALPAGFPSRRTSSAL